MRSVLSPLKMWSQTVTHSMEDPQIEKVSKNLVEAWSTPMGELEIELTTH